MGNEVVNNLTVKGMKIDIIGCWDKDTPELSYDFYDIEGLTEETINFSLLTTAIGYQHIAAYVGLESSQDISQERLNNKLEVLTHWLFEKDESGRTRLGDSRNIQHLKDNDSEMVSDDANFLFCLFNLP